MRALRQSHALYSFFTFRPIIVQPFPIRFNIINVFLRFLFFNIITLIAKCR